MTWHRIPPWRTRVTPRSALALLGVILLGFAVGPVFGIEPVAVAVAGAVVMAVLIGVNVGPNLTDTGSLATLLWRGCCMTGVTGSRWPGSPGSVCLTVPACVLLATIAPWLVLAVA